ncbi:MAG: dTDP-4-amino-4,6-dideoxygalactose transaminase, partial [Pirellulaceae bacterium]
MIPLCDVNLQHSSIEEELLEAMRRVLASGKYILGPEVEQFEQEVADYCGVRFAVGLNSGTDALHLALRSLDIGPGDEVITTPFTFVATTEAILMVGAKPVFVDIHRDTFNLDANQLEKKITPRTKAIIPVHLYGQPCDMPTIMSIAERHGVHVVEDCAQSIGASLQSKKAGAFGISACLSFFPSKNLGAIGDAGMLLTDDPEIYQRVEFLRRHGGRVKYHHEELGVNSRLDELQAAVLRVKLRKLSEWNEQRRSLAYAYNVEFGDVAEVTCPSELRENKTYVPRLGAENSFLTSVYHQYTILVEDRDAVLHSLKDDDIGCAVYYPVPL